MLHRNRTDSAAGIQVDDRILIQVAGLYNRSATELDVQGVRTFEILDFHRLKLRSKKALCAVLPSGSNTTLKSRLPAKVNLISPKTGESLKTRLRMRYVSLYVEYVYYRKNKWELSVPVQLGIGSTKYVTFTNPKSNYQSPGYLVLLYEPCLSVNYRVLPFVAVGTEMGLRLALLKNNQEIQPF